MKTFKVVIVTFTMVWGMLSMQSTASAGTSTTQWAAIANSDNEYDENYTASEATGAPNANGCDKAAQVWASQGTTDIATLNLEFTNSVVPTYINIYQNNFVGAIATVQVSADGTNWTDVYTGTPSNVTAGTCSQANYFDDILSIPVTAIKTQIDKMRINIQQSAKGSADIDAVMLVGEKGTQKISLSATSVILGQSLKLPAQTSAQLAVTWLTSTAKVCSINAGRVKGLKKGTCRLIGINVGDDSNDAVTFKKSITVKKAKKNSGGVNAALPNGVATDTLGVKVGKAWNKPNASTIPLLELWEDFQCPACKQMETDSGSKIASLATAGKLRVLFRPTIFLDTNLAAENSASGNPKSSLAATMAFGCAIDAGKALEYHAKLFTSQPEEGKGFSADDLTGFAQDVGISGPKLSIFSDCFATKKYEAWAKNSHAKLIAAGLTATPTGILNGKALKNEVLFDPTALGKVVTRATK